MKKLFSFFLFLMFASGLQAQWIVQSFDNAVQPNTSIGTNWADTAIVNTNFFTNGPTAYMDLYNDADSYDGGGSMAIDYRIEAFDGWGGYDVRTDYHEVDISTVPYLDLSSGTELSVWVKVVTPADTTQAGTVFMEFKLAEFNENDEREYYYYQPDINFFDESGEWVNVTMPLVQTDDKTTGFAPQSATVDGVLDFDEVKGFEMAMVYITAGNSDNPPAASGKILLDKLQLLGTRYGPIETFDNSATTWGIDEMSWHGTAPGALTVADENTDFVEGTGALKVDFTLSAPEVWGGFVAIDKDVTVHDSMAERTALVLYVKNLVAMQADSGRAFLRVFVFENDNDNGDVEQWIIDADVDFSETFDWTHCYLPLVKKEMGVNDRFPPKDGFALKSGNGDGFLNPAAITKIRIEPFGRGTEDGFADVMLAEGSILLDVMQTSGDQIYDIVAPEAPAVAVVKGSYSNLVTWTDVPNESGETYNVYVSENPITDVEAEGVEAISKGVLEDVQVVEHPIVSANDDKERTFYYAVTCSDQKPNVSEPGVSAAVTNTAKGIPTVSITPPVFVADGDLSEWAHITPWEFSVEDGSGTVISTIDDDQDLAVKCYAALDNEYLYIAYDINDDVVNHDPTLDSWLNDAPDFYIGFYDWTTPHVGYQHGANPDYHLRFGKFLARNDQNESSYDSLLVAGTEDYYWGERTFPAGYVVEARISLEDLATKRNSESAIIDTITWQSGWNIPFDIGVNDNDGADREGMMYYSYKATDNAWQNVNEWARTWIHDDVVAVGDDKILENRYELSQNYPNPFNPTTKINYSLKNNGIVKLRVFDILGRQVAELVNQQQAAGTYSVDFNASNYASGLYFYTLESGSFTQTKKMMLIK